MNNWKERIALNYLVLIEMEKVDLEHLWEYHYPEVACTPEKIVEVEQKLGIKLDEDYKQMLLCINGWDCFYQYVNLFHIEDLLGSDRMNYANTLLDVLYRDGVPPKYAREEIMPIASTMIDSDVFAITLNNSDEAGRVIWFAEGNVIDDFDSVSAFFETMITLNQDEVQELKKENA